MMGIIVGVNRVEYISVKKKDLKRHFFVTRDQLYKFYPDCMQKMRLEDNLGLIRTESVIIYPENGIRPYGWKEPLEGESDPFDFNTILGNLDDHKHLSYKSRFGKFKMYLTTGKSVFESLTPLLLVLLVAGVIIGAFTGVLH